MKSAPKRVLVMAIAFLTTAASSYATDTGYGASAATAAIKTGQAFTIVDMLRWAAEDEYLAHGEYAAIMKKFGAMRPYDNIMAAEEQHLAWLKEEFRIRGLPFPSDGSASAIVVPSDLKAAAQAGVDAEIANIAMYAAFLARPELSRPEYASVKDLFERLMRASENHLKAFRNQLSKY